MQIDPRGQPPEVTQRPGDRDTATEPEKRRRRSPLLVLALAVAFAATLFLARHAVAGFIVARAVEAGTGDRLTYRAMRVGTTRTVIDDLRLTTRSGDPLLTANRVSLRYSLPELLLRRGRRFGLSGLTLERPVLTVVRHADGSYNVGGGAGGNGVAGPTSPGLPWQFNVAIRSGEIRLQDQAPAAADLAEQRLTPIDLTARIDSGRISVVEGRAIWLGRRTAAARLEAWPIALHARADTQRGLAEMTARAAGLPLRGALGYLIHSGAVRFDGGIARDVRLSLYALNAGQRQPLDVHAGGRAELVDGAVSLAALRRPVRNVRGRLTLTDDGVWSPRLSGMLDGIAIAAQGGIYNRAQPTFALGITGDGDLHELRTLFAFSHTQPVLGRAHVETLIEAPIANLLIRTSLTVPRGRYGNVPLSALDGRVDYHASTVVLDGLRAHYGAADVRVGGRFLLAGPALDSAIVLSAHAPGGRTPYAQNIAPESEVNGLALITGGAAGFRARGAIGLAGKGLTGGGPFLVDERGVGEFGPFAFTRSDGSSLVGALRLERPTSRSAAWLSARNYRFAGPAAAARLPGLTLPAFPPIAGTLDGDLAGGGSPDGFAVAGHVHGRGLRVANASLGTGDVQLGGTLRDVRLTALTLDGALGHYRGAAAVAGGTFALSGGYDGSLEQLVPLTGDQKARGGVHGSLLATLDGHSVIVQSRGAVLQHGFIRGVALDNAAGTLAVRGNAFHLIVADGRIGGRRAVARESNGTVAVSAPDVPSSALRGTGVPLDAGNLSLFGIADLRGRAPSFDGTMAVAGGRTRGYRVAGDAQLDLDGSRATIFAATGALGSTYGSFGGRIDGIGQRTLQYDVDMDVPLGDIGLLRTDLHLPVAHLAGSFGAQLHVSGAGSRPFVHGRIAAPEGSYNGLAFRDATADLVLDADGVAARNGTITVGTTRTAVSASTGGGRFGLEARAAAARLADFNDYFDAGDTLAGSGSFDVGLRTYGASLVTHGAVDLRDLRFRDFTLGETLASWRTNAGAVRGTLAVHGAAGSATARIAIVPAAEADPIRALRSAGYDVTARLDRVDLGTWLPAAGIAQPILGNVDASLTVAGRIPRLVLGIDAALNDATVAGLPVRNGRLRATAVGTRVNVQSAGVDVGFATLSAAGKLGVAADDPLAFNVRGSTADIGRAIRTFVPAARTLDVAGALDADVRFGGTYAKPAIEGGFDLSNARYGSFAVPRAIGALALAGKAIELRDADVEFTRGQAFVAGSLPLQLAPPGLGPPGAPVSFDVTARSVDLAQFSPLLPAGTTLGGVLDGRFGVEGTVDRPRMLGSMSIAGGSYLSRFERAPIAHFNARLAFAGSSVALQTFHADVGSGTLDAGGEIRLPFGANPSTSYTLDVRAKAAQLDFPAYGRGTIDGDLRLTSGAAVPLVSGTIALRDAAIPVSAVYGGGPAGAGAAGGAPYGLTVDPALALHAAAGRNVRIRSGIVDIGVTGAVDVSGTLKTPRLAGDFSATDGTVSSYNHVFRVVNAKASFNPADGILPTIDARATARVTNPDPDPSRNIAGSANITVTVSGTPDSNNLQVTYSSDPPYSQEQIVGLLLDVPALLGAVNFNLNGPGSQLLRGAPGETNALLPPGVTPEQVSAISLNQEVFSLLNGQLTQRALTPVERVFEKIFGLSDLQFTVDYGGGLGYSLRRQIGKRDFSAFLSQTVTYPERANIGFELTPRPYETVNFSVYQQSGVTSLITNATPGLPFAAGATRRLTSVQPLGNRSGFSLNFNRRF